MGLAATCEAVAGSSKQLHSESVDLISNLPINVTQCILECLPLHHAVRMSILSRHWRYQWTMLPQLLLDLEFYDAVRKQFNTGSTDASKLYSNIINNILLCHVGPIVSFVLYIPSGFPTNTHISQWIQFVSHKGVKKLTLTNAGGHIKKLPSCLFSCGGLTHLTLINCSFLYIPPTFKGFPYLCSMYLKLWEPLLPSEAKMLEDVISFCPQLQNLSLFINAKKICLTICAPNLEHLELDGFLSSLSLKGSKNIKRLQLLCLQDGVLLGDVEELLCLLKCQNLVLCPYFWPDSLGVRFCQHSDLEPPEKLADELGCLQTLDLGIPLNCNVAVNFALFLFRSSPRLQRLCIKASTKYCCPIGKKLLRIEDSCTLNCLKHVDFVLEQSRDLQLVELLLACSPVLEVMTIVLNKHLKAEQKLEIAKQVMCFCRASPTVKIILKP